MLSVFYLTVLQSWTVLSKMVESPDTQVPCDELTDETPCSNASWNHIIKKMEPHSPASDISRQSNVPFLINISSRVLCRDSYVIMLGWKIEETSIGDVELNHKQPDLETQFNLENQTRDLGNQTIDLGNDLGTRPRNVMFLVQMKKAADWMVINMTSGQYITVADLTPDTGYQFRIVAATSPATVVGVSEIEAATFPESYNMTSIPVLYNTSVRTYANGSIGLKLEWGPDSDEFCRVALFYYYSVHEGYATPVILEKPHSVNSAELISLKPSTRYFFQLQGLSYNRSKERSSQVLSFTETIPSCLQLYQGDLNICAPDPPRNLTVLEIVADDSKYDLNISWTNNPAPLPFRHWVQFYRISSGPSSDAGPVGEDRTAAQVDGNQTSFTFRGLVLGRKYKVTVHSESAAGNGSTVSSTRSLAAMRAAPAATPPHAARVVLVITAASVFILLALYLVNGRGRNKAQPQLPPKLVHNTSSPVQTSTLSRKYGRLITSNNWKDEWDIALDRLLLGHVLGQGEYGVVVKGLLREKGSVSGAPVIEVAVKMLKANADERTYERFLKEINLMKYVGKHEHIVSFIGCCYQEELRLVVEYCVLGDLQSYLRRAYKYNRKSYANRGMAASDPASPNSGIKYENLPATPGGFAANQMYDVTDLNPHHKPPLLLDTVDLLTYAYQIAAGMDYLSHNKVVHRDLAARNILLASAATVKISDFGLSEDIYEQNVFTTGEARERLPIKWLALESLVNSVYTSKSDVWSYGVVLWEIVTLGANPYPHIPLSRILHVLKQGYRMECPASCSTHIYNIMLQCWQTRPKDRPSFSQLASSFQQFLNETTGSASVALTQHDYLQLDQLLNEEDEYERDAMQSVSQ